MVIKHDCPYAKTGEMMRVYCKDGQLCAFQYFKSCKGWWTNTPAAQNCKKRSKK